MEPLKLSKGDSAEAESPFTAPPPPLEEGIWRALESTPRLPLAQRSNLWHLTSRFYEPLWRSRSIGLLTSGTYSVERELGCMVEWLDPREGQVLLDAACSAALYGRRLKAHAPQAAVYALDLSLPFLRQARLYAQRDEVNLEPVHGDVQALPFADDRFDAIACGGSANEFSDLPRALSEFSRVLKPGGRLWLMYLRRAETFLGRSGQRALELSGLRFPTPDRLAGEAEQLGLRLSRSDYRGPVVLSLFKLES